jgi:hypothetical protein
VLPHAAGQLDGIAHHAALERRLGLGRRRGARAASFSAAVWVGDGAVGAAATREDNVNVYVVVVVVVIVVVISIIIIGGGVAHARHHGRLLVCLAEALGGDVRAWPQ